MGIDFPVATTVGQTYTDPTSGNTYAVTVVGPPAQWVGSGSSTSLDNTYLRKDASNDPVTGTLTVTPATNVEGLVVTQGATQTATALRITNEGSGNALVVEDGANPDSTPTVIDPSGRLINGYNTSRQIGAGQADLQVYTNGPGLATLRYTTSAAGHGLLTLARSRGTTPGDNTAVLLGDGLGRIDFVGADGTDLINRGAYIAADAEVAPSTGRVPAYLTFATTPTTGSTTPLERMRIASGGDLLFGGTLPSSPNISIFSSGLIINVATDGTINNGASISVTVPSRAAGACYLVAVSRRQGNTDNFQGLYLVHYSVDSTPQAVITITALASMTVSASGATITLTNNLGFLTAARISALRIS